MSSWPCQAKWCSSCSNATWSCFGRLRSAAALRSELVACIDGDDAGEQASGIEESALDWLKGGEKAAERASGKEERSLDLLNANQLSESPPNESVSGLPMT